MSIRRSVRDVLCICTCLTVLWITVISIRKDEYLKLENQFYDARPKNSDNLITMEMLENEYCIGYNFLKATKSFRESDGLEPVTLATHATSDMINELENIPEIWDGPISISLFLDVQSQNALIYLSAVHRCVPGFREKVSLHIAYRMTPFQKSCQPMPMMHSNVSCHRFLGNKNLLRHSLTAPFALYPCSLMRSVARKGAMTDLHFIMDADMIVSEGMAERVKKVANEMIDGHRKTVLLVRRFENDHVDIPRDVGDLEEALREERTFEFHHAFYSVAHKIENLDSWVQYSTTSSEVTTWPIQYPGPEWEPQPILHRNDPYNAAYFPSRLKDMQSLIYKLCRANYTFHVVSHVFNVHKGVKTRDNLYSQAVAEHQKKYARERAQQRFTREMDHLYPGTLNHCGRFEI